MAPPWTITTRALALQRELRNRAGEALTLNNIGSVYEKLGRVWHRPGLLRPEPRPVNDELG
jgi:hypothetical protein